jgi:hypothetical protein
MVGTETLGGPDFLDRRQVFFHTLHVFLDVCSQHTVRGCPTNRNGKQKCTVHQFCPVCVCF